MTPALLVLFLVKSKPNRVIVRGERPANHTDTPLKFYKIYDNHFDIVNEDDVIKTPQVSMAPTSPPPLVHRNVTQNYDDLNTPPRVHQNHDGTNDVQKIANEAVLLPQATVAVRAQDDGNVFTNEQVTDYLKYRRCLGADVSLLGI